MHLQAMIEMLRTQLTAALFLLAQLEARQENYPAERSLSDEILPFDSEGDDKPGICSSLEQLAVVVAA